MKKIVAAILCFVSVNAMAQQIVTMKSGDKMNGKVQSLNNDVLEFMYKGNLMKIKTTEIYSINFSEAPQSGDMPSTSAAPHEVGEKQVMAGNYMVRYKVADRVIVRQPKVDNLTQEKGTVVVEITIDKYGHIIKATPGAAGSTTNSDYLKTKAKQAAESAMFDNVPTAPLEQKGYMIIVF